MARKKWIFIFTLFMAVAQQQIHAACVCNAKGEDGCAKCSGAIRPKPNHPKRPDFELPPVGDNCWCSKTLIEPASLPKPCSKLKNGAPTCNSPGLASPPHYYAMPEVNYVQAVVKDNSPPADPISISLAVQAGKAIEVPEAKLSYGFVRKPINGLPKLFLSSIKEENLYALANDVITLKKPTGTRMKKLEEDYPEPEEEEPVPEDYEPPGLTYRQLGYDAEVFKNPEFAPMPAFPEEVNTLLADKADMNCGFKPGRIAKMNHAGKFHPINYFVKH